MADIPITIAKDPRKVRLRELKARPVFTPQESTEAIKLLMELAGVKEA